MDCITREFAGPRRLIRSAILAAVGKCPKPNERGEQSVFCINELVESIETVEFFPQSASARTYSWTFQATQPLFSLLTIVNGAAGAGDRPPTEQRLQTVFDAPAVADHQAVALAEILHGLADLLAVVDRV